MGFIEWTLKGYWPRFLFLHPSRRFILLTLAVCFFRTRSFGNDNYNVNDTQFLVNIKSQYKARLPTRRLYITSSVHLLFIFLLARSSRNRLRCRCIHLLNMLTNSGRWLRSSCAWWNGSRFDILRGDYGADHRRRRGIEHITDIFRMMMRHVMIVQLMVRWWHTEHHFGLL